MRLHYFLAISLCSLTILSSQAMADTSQPISNLQVSATKALYKQGKTFIVFDRTLDYKGEYLIYRSNKVIKSVAGLTPIASIKNNSYMNRLCKTPYVIPFFGELIEQQGLFVYTPDAKQKAYYAVLTVSDTPQKLIMDQNSISEGVDEEKTEFNYPFLQQTIDKYGFLQDNYCTWLDQKKWPIGEEDLGSFFAVTYEKDFAADQKRPVDMFLHSLSAGWGGKPSARYEKGMININFKDHYRQWWRGRSAERIMAGLRGFLDMTKLNYDKNRIYLRGQSMGGDGGAYHAVVNGDLFAAAHVDVPRLIPEIHTKLVAADADMPPLFIVWAFNDGKNFKADGELPFYKKMTACYQGYYAHWEDMVHAGVNEYWKTADKKFIPIGGLYRFKKNEAFPVFLNCSADDNFGQLGDENIVKAGNVNMNIDWGSELHPLGIKNEKQNDTATKFVMSFKAVEDCTADVAFRRVQKFSVKTGNKIKYVNVDSNNKVLQKGNAVVIKPGLILLKDIKFISSGNIIKLLR